MKTLIATPHLRLKQAGGARFPISLAESLADQAHDVVLLGFSSYPAMDKESRSEKGSVYLQKWIEDPLLGEWGRYPRYDGYRHIPALYDSCARLLSTNRPEVIIINSLNRLGNLVEAAWESGIPIMYIACDLGSTCINEVGLFERDDSRCVGPGDAKCVQCQSALFTWPKFLISRLVRPFLLLSGFIKRK